MTGGARAARGGSRLRAWMELLRVPNLFTVPGDIVAGAFLAGVSAERLPLLLPVSLTSLLLYGAGLVMNDYRDRRVDSVERPERPVPSGRVPAAAALAAGVLMSGGALLYATLLGSVAGPAVPAATAGVAALVLLYNSPVRRSAVAGLVVMGLCRGANLLLGAAAAGAPLSGRPVAGALLSGLYIAGVSAIARRETTAAPGPLVRWLPIVPVAAMTGLLFDDPWLPANVAAWLPALAWVYGTLRGVGSGARPVPQAVGMLVRGLVLIQILLVAAGPPNGYAPSAIVLLVMLFAGATAAARRFYGS